MEINPVERRVYNTLVHKEKNCVPVVTLYTPKKWQHKVTHYIVQGTQSLSQGVLFILECVQYLETFVSDKLPCVLTMY